MEVDQSGVRMPVYWLTSATCSPGIPALPTLESASSSQTASPSRPVPTASQVEIQYIFLCQQTDLFRNLSATLQWTLLLKGKNTQILLHKWLILAHTLARPCLHLTSLIGRSGVWWRHWELLRLQHASSHHHHGVELRQSSLHNQLWRGVRPVRESHLRHWRLQHPGLDAWRPGGTMSGRVVHSHWSRTLLCWCLP